MLPKSSQMPFNCSKSKKKTDVQCVSKQVKGQSYSSASSSLATVSSYVLSCRSARAALRDSDITMLLRPPTNMYMSFKKSRFGCNKEHKQGQKDARKARMKGLWEVGYRGITVRHGAGKGILNAGHPSVSWCIRGSVGGSIPRWEHELISTGLKARGPCRRRWSTLQVKDKHVKNKPRTHKREKKSCVLTMEEANEGIKNSRA